MTAVILLVEDDVAARLALGKVLEVAGYTVHIVGTGLQAIQAIEQTEFDVVISDMRLPDIDGIEVLQVAKSQPLPPAVLLLTGYGTLDTAIAALRAGAHDYLLKPCSPQVLLTGVEGALQRRTAAVCQADTIRSLAQGVAQLQQHMMAIGITPSEETPAHHTPTSQSPSNLLRIGALHVGRFPHEALYHDQPLHLTPIEHALVRCLAEAAGQVVLYSDIIRRTHGYSASDSEAQMLLKSHVRNIRRKTGADLIVNVRNVGYRLVDERDEQHA